MQVVPDDDVPLLLRLFGPDLDGKAHVDVSLKIRGDNDEAEVEKPSKENTTGVAVVEEAGGTRLLGLGRKKNQSSFSYKLSPKQVFIHIFLTGRRPRPLCVACRKTCKG